MSCGNPPAGFIADTCAMVNNPPERRHVRDNHAPTCPTDVRHDPTIVMRLFASAFGENDDAFTASSDYSLLPRYPDDISAPRIDGIDSDVGQPALLPPTTHSSLEQDNVALERTAKESDE